MDESRRIERRVTLHDLRVLMSVIGAGSMGRAARQLATSQPAISRSIADLEHTLGARLLDRSARGIEPTPYGRALLARGTVMFDELRQGIMDLKVLANPTSGEVSIGASIAIAQGLVSSVISRVAQRYPGFSFRVLASDTATASRALLDRKVDFAVVHIIEPLAEEPLDIEPLLHDPFVVIAGAQNPLTRRRRLALADLLNQPWALPLPDQPYGAVAREAFRASGADFPIIRVGSTLPVRTALLATGPFLSMVPRIVMQFPPENRLLKTLRVDLPATARSLALVTLKNRTLNPAAHLVMDRMRATAKLLAKES